MSRKRFHFHPIRWVQSSEDQKWKGTDFDPSRACRATLLFCNITNWHGKIWRDWCRFHREKYGLCLLKRNESFQRCLLETYSHRHIRWSQHKPGNLQWSLTQMRRERPRLTTIYCANHRVDLALKEVMNVLFLKEAEQLYESTFKLLKRPGALKAAVKQDFCIYNLEQCSSAPANFAATSSQPSVEQEKDVWTSLWSATVVSHLSLLGIYSKVAQELMASESNAKIWLWVPSAAI